MSQTLWRLLIMTAVVVATAAAHANPAEITSRYTKLSSCREVDHGEDWVFHKCKGYGAIPIWLAFTDSARGHVGFGRRPNFSGTYGLDRGADWLVEWRGRQKRTGFEPIVVIIRMNSPAGGPEGSSLIVYRLRGDGTSCVVGSTEGSNAVAEDIADQAMDNFHCIEEPERP